MSRSRTKNVGAGLPREDLPDLASMHGYVLKQATTALDRAMEAALRDLDLSIAQYAALEVVARNPGISVSDLARVTFVSRQAAHQVTQRLLADKALTRRSTGGSNGTTALDISARGELVRSAGARAVADVEARVTGAMSTAQAEEFMTLLQLAIDSLTQP